MINFPTIVKVILEAEENTHGQRQGGLTGKSFNPRGFGKSSAIQGIGLYNRDAEDRWENDTSINPKGHATKDAPEGLTQQQAQAEVRQKQKQFYKKMALVFSAVNSNPELKGKAEDTIKEYMVHFAEAQALRQRISRNINMGDTRKSFIPGASDKIGSKDLPRGESDTMVVDKGKPSQLALDAEKSEHITEWLEDNEQAVYEHFLNTVIVEVATSLYKRKEEALAAKRQESDDTEKGDGKDLEYFKNAVHDILSKWYDIKTRSYQESKERYVTGGRGFSYGISTPVSSIASWLNSGAVQVGREQERAARSIITYNNSKRVVGAIEHIPEGKKVKRLLDIVDEVKHGFSTDAERTSRFYTPGKDVGADKKMQSGSYTNSEEFKNLKSEAFSILSDLDIILGSGQLELLKLLQAFFNEEPSAEGALVKFILNDVVAAFNS